MTTPNPTHPQPERRKAKLPRARALCWDGDHKLGQVDIRKDEITPVPVAVISFATQKQARAFVKVWNMTKEERIIYLANVILKNDPPFKTRLVTFQSIESVLTALGFDAAK